MNFRLATPLLGLTLIAASCDKSGDKPAEATDPPAAAGEKAGQKNDQAAGEPAGAAQAGKAADDSAAAVGGALAAAPAAGATPAGWKLYENKEARFSVMGPPAAPMSSTDNSVPDMSATMWQFPIGQEGLGQIMVLKYTGPEAYDPEAGLDGAIKNAIATIHGTMTKYEKTPNKERVARQFAFDAKASGIAIQGVGRGVVTGPKRLTVGMAFWKKGNATIQSQAGTFIDSMTVQ